MHEIVFSGLIVAVTGYLLYITTTFPHPHALEGELHADFWPRLILIGLLVTSSFLAIVSTIKSIARKKPSHGKSKEVAEEGVAAQQTSKRRLVLAVFMTLLYIYLMEIFGVLVLTPIFLFFFMYNMGLRKKVSLVIVPLIVTVLVIITFTKVLPVMLPRGKWIFRDISLLIY